jgi:hypothetical protein
MVAQTHFNLSHLHNLPIEAEEPTPQQFWDNLRKVDLLKITAKSLLEDLTSPNPSIRPGTVYEGVSCILLFDVNLVFFSV